MFHYIFNIVNWSSNLVQGFPNIRGSVRVGTVLADILGIFFGIFVPIFCLIGYYYFSDIKYHWVRIILTFVFFVCLMVFVHMFPSYVDGKYKSFYYNFPIWMSILSLTFGINNVHFPGTDQSLGLFVSIFGYFIYVMIAFFNLI